MVVRVFAESCEFVLVRHLPMAIRRLPMVKNGKGNTFLEWLKKRSAGFNIDIFSVLFVMAGGRWSGNPRNGKWRFFYSVWNIQVAFMYCGYIHVFGILFPSCTFLPSLSFFYLVHVLISFSAAYLRITFITFLRLYFCFSIFSFNSLFEILRQPSPYFYSFVAVFLLLSIVYIPLFYCLCFFAAKFISYAQRSHNSHSL
jgi:hypothetical protein